MKLDSNLALNEVQAPSFQIEREAALDPPAQIEVLRKTQGPSRVTLWDGSKAWLAVHYDDVRAVLSDPRFSTVTTREGYPFVSQQRKEVLTRGRPNFTFMDAPDHTKFRRALMPLFAVKRLSAVRDYVEQTVDGLIDDMLASGSQADFVDAFALALPVRVLSHFTGVPFADCALFLQAGRDRFDLESDPENSHASGEELWAYLDTFIREKEQGDLVGEDATTWLLREQVAQGNLTRDDVILIINQMLVAGFDTTGNTLAMAGLVLLENPQEYRKLIDDPEKVPQAVNEVLRYASVLQFHSSRAATEDIEIGGQIIRKGEGVIALLHGANRDPIKFPNPETFDIDRKSAHHMAFSFGMHQCLGQSLARMELQIALRGMVTRLPELRLVDRIEDIDFATHGLTYGPHHFTVAW